MERSAEAPAKAQPSKDVRYGQIADLLKAAEGAGLSCSGRWLRPKRVRLSADSRYCSPEGSLEAFAIYSSDTNKDKAVQESVEFAQIWRDENAPELISSIIVGPNWTVEGSLDELKKVQKGMGGVLQDNTCAVPGETGSGC